MPTHRAHRGEVQPVTAIVLGAFAIVLIVAAVLGARPSVAGPGPSPSAPPSAPANPSSAPSANPSAKPSAPANPSASPVAIKLQSATNHDVSLKIQDPDAIVTDARSGKPGDGMSVRWHDSSVVNLDDDTIEVIFVGLPGDETVDLVVSAVDGGLHLTLVQAGPMPQSDAMGEDRVLVLSFARPIAAHDVTVEILDRTVD